MNLSIRSTFLVACVAVALVLAGCAPATVQADKAEPVPTSTTAPEPEPTTQPTSEPTPEEEPYDEWINWTSGNDPSLIEERNDTLYGPLAEALGVAFFAAPNPVFLDDGWIGVAQLGSRCILAILMDEQSPEDGGLSMTVMSRFDTSLTVAIPRQTDVNRLREPVDTYRDWCGNLTDEVPTESSTDSTDA